MTKTLRVMDVERFATKDGPGIRTTVFLKGCPLHCPWCANPESQSATTQLLWFSNKCTACGGCLTACGQGARSGRPGKSPAGPGKVHRLRRLRGGLPRPARCRFPESSAPRLRCWKRCCGTRTIMRLPAGRHRLRRRAADPARGAGGVSLPLQAARPALRPAETCGAFTPAALETCAPWLDLFSSI